MKTKIFNALKQAYSNLGLGDEVLQEQAGALAATGFVTDENLATVVQGQKTFLSSIQTTLDKARTERTKAEKEAKEKADKEAEEKAAAEASKGKTEPTQAEIIAAAVAEAMKPFAEKLTTFETQTAVEKRQSEIAAKAKEYGVPDSFISKFNIPADANLDDYFKGVKQDFANIGFAGNQPPETSEQRIAKESEDIANMIATGTKEIIDNQKK